MKTPWHYWLITVLAAVWFAGGAYDYVMMMTDNQDYQAILTEEQRAWMATRPTWFVWCWAISIWSAVAGVVLMVLRSRKAGLAFLVSLIGYLASCVWSYGLSEPKAWEVTGTGGTVMGVAIGIFLLLIMLYCAGKARQGVLR